MRFSTCTVITRDRFAYVRVLADSVHAQHPDASVFALVVDPDAAEDCSDEPFTVVTPADVGIDDEELHRRATAYTPFELTGSFRPLLLSWALAQTGQPVLYLDCDVRVYGDLEPLADQAAAAGVVLSPHEVVAPGPGPTPAEWAYLSAGVFNSGYLGVGPEGDSAPFLDWWADRTARHCLSDTSRSQFVEQRWLSVAPGLFDLEVCRDPGANLMGWRLGAHDVDADTLTFLDRPVRTFHFCGGFDPDQPHRLATMPGLPWPEAPSRPGAVALCRGYARELLAAGFHAELARPYRYAALPDGRPLDRFVRHAYLRGLVEAEAAGTSRPPTAFDGQFDRMLAWLAAPAQDVPLSRYHHELWRQRTDLQFAFPTAATTNPEPFERWIGQHPEHTQLAELRPSGH